MIVVGADEVGLGALAGPLFVGAAAFSVDNEVPIRPDYFRVIDLVFSPLHCPIEGVKDSKKFGSDLSRRRVLDKIKPVALRTGVGIVQVQEFEILGVSAALATAFRRALASVSPRHQTRTIRDDTLVELALQAVDDQPPFDLVLVDGEHAVARYPHAQANRPKGDSAWWPVAAASIVAKVTRDAVMCELAEQYPAYDWKSNKGYGTTSHIRALQEHGMSPQHRSQYCETALATAREKAASGGSQEA